MKNNGNSLSSVAARTYNSPWQSASYFAPLCMLIPLNALTVYSNGDIYNLNLNDNVKDYPRARRYTLLLCFLPAVSAASGALFTC